MTENVRRFMGAPFQTTTLGYPRLGNNRQYKILLEEFWTNPIDEQGFIQAMRRLEANQLRTQLTRFGINLVCCGDFSLYDHVLDTAAAVGCVPPRFGNVDSSLTPKQYFILARGAQGVSALEMTKWFNTNYHYLVPELPQKFRLLHNPLRDAIQRGKQAVNAEVKPWILGPFTFLRLAKLQGDELARRLPELTEIYQQILAGVKSDPVPLIQVDEPALVTDVSEIEWQALEQCYKSLSQFALPLCVQTYYGDVASVWERLIQLPVAAIGIDLVADEGRNLKTIRAGSFPADKILVAGILNGRNVWRSDLNLKLKVIQQLADRVNPDRLLLAPSCSLLHLPETVQIENHLPEELSGGLCFAQERLEELVLLAKAARCGTGAVANQWQQAEELRARWLRWTQRHAPAVQTRINQLKDADFTRLPRDKRKSLQQQRLRLPLLPTTTIGSFTQTAELRSARAKRTKDPEAYAQTIRAEVEKVIRLQETVGLDVLVDGESDRSDMVEFFAEKLPGCAALKYGWVQSYGSRCVRPPIIYGDVWRQKPLTLEVSRFAQSLTNKPVKGMLTGPVTILCWSFVRDDVPLKQVAYQIALAIRDEALALEQEVKLAIIQIDEPAFREGLPLKTRDQSEYLEWAVRTFRLASSGVRSETQIHTHMCYAEFRDILPAIAVLDADVISVEDARSHGEMLEVLNTEKYPGEVGPGVWDIHSPQVPSVEFVVSKLRQTLLRLPADRVWVNPDCGLKTRKYEEVIPSIKNMIEAARLVRAEL